MANLTREGFASLPMLSGMVYWVGSCVGSFKCLTIQVADAGQISANSRVFWILPGTELRSISTKPRLPKKRGAVSVNK